VTAYYNEFDPYAAQWLRNLIEAGHIAPGIVDERSIEDVVPSDLEGFTQCHFFAGIGVWSLALRRAGWPDNRPVWTGSCPCQPFSSSGAGTGFDDERHLWPAFFHLVGERKPPVLFGEQVAASAEWLNLVRNDMGAVGYAVGSMPIEAASAGAHHLRSRIFFVADADGLGWSQRGLPASGSIEAPGEWSADIPGDASTVDFVMCLDGRKRPVEPGTRTLVDAHPRRVGKLRAYGNGIDAGAATQFVAAYLESTGI